jgi:predicted anti-sigma-YlaC factor YlaD
MPETDCRETRRLLALGEADRVEGHLTRCPECRLEAERIADLVRDLERGAEQTPPAGLDRTVRAALAAPRRIRRPVLLPLPAVLLSLTALGTLAVALSQALEGTAVGDLAPFVTFILIAIYLAVSSTALLPVLLQGRNLKPAGSRMVRP